MYVSEVRKELYARLTDTILVGNVDVCQFNALIFRLQSQLVKAADLTEEVIQPPPTEEEMGTSPLPANKTQRSSSMLSMKGAQARQPTVESTIKSSRVRTTSISSAASSLRTPLGKSNRNLGLNSKSQFEESERSLVID
jgi:hypothetical protein